MNLSRRGHPQAVIDVAAELLEEVEREGEPRGRAADLTEVEPHLEGQRDLRLLQLDAEERKAGVGRVPDRADEEVSLRSVAPYTQRQGFAGAALPEDPREVIRNRAPSAKSTPGQRFTEVPA